MLLFYDSMLPPDFWHPEEVPPPSSFPELALLSFPDGTRQGLPGTLQVRAPCHTRSFL